ncbi:hypothetical protein CCP3SC1AL1_190005 [Gammaproteobacteria bacterium]
MRRMYEFACKNGHKTERFVDYELTSFVCECFEESHRILSAPAFKLEGWSGTFPSAHGRFEKSHLDRLKAEQKLNS